MPPAEKHAPQKKEPRIPFFSDTVFSLPILGGIRGYYVILALLFFGYVFSKSFLPTGIGDLIAIAFGLAAGAFILFVVIWEFYAGVKTGGLKNEIAETAIALLVALLLWFGSGFLLNTQSPVNAIVSCSMLPAYEKGDMVLLQGAAPDAPVVKIAENISAVAQKAKIYSPDGSFDVDGSLYAYCVQSGANDAKCQRFVSSPDEYSEVHGPLEIMYGKCGRVWPKTGQTAQTVCAIGAKIDGMPVMLGKTNDLIVYEARKGEAFGQRDIIHRVAFIIEDAKGDRYYFTKGDNNAIYDFQVYDSGNRLGNSPIAQGQVKGKVIARLPYVGNLKLFITPAALVSPETLSGCDSQFAN